MGTYASSSDVSARLAGRTIDASSKPTSTQVEQWITEAEARLTGALRAANVSMPVTDTDGIETLKSWACDYAEGHTRKAWVSADGEGSVEANNLLEAFEKRLVDIKESPSWYEAMLQSGDGNASVRVRAYVLSNADSKTITDGDFDPEFDREFET